MPQDSGSSSFLPSALTMEALLDAAEPDLMQLIKDPMEDDVPQQKQRGYFSRSSSLLGYNQSPSVQDPCLSARHFNARFNSNGSFVDSDADLNCSQESKISLSDLEAMVAKSDLEGDNYNMAPPEDTNVPRSRLLDSEVIVPRCRTPDPLETLPDSVDDLTAKLNPVTPTKTDEAQGTKEVDPWTPTANLKMLISAASPEIRNRDKLRELFSNQLPDDLATVVEATPQTDILNHGIPEAPCKQDRKRKKGKSGAKKALHAEAEDEGLEGVFAKDEDGEEEDQPVTGRKERSLGLLCTRFLELFPEYPDPQNPQQLSLDDVARCLGVERRRIYDIINVLESVELVSRLAKNKYTWHGKTNLRHTLAKLKTLATMEGLGEQLERYKDYQISRDLELPQKSSKTTETPSVNTEDSKDETTALSSQDSILKDNLRRDNSLGILSQKFIMLFLVSKPRVVNLDLAAKILIGDADVDRTEVSKFKTKIRRLYDIANILTSLGLVRKVHVTEVRGRKPAFRYTGPDIDNVHQFHGCTNDNHKPTRHSLLGCVQNSTVNATIQNHTPTQSLASDQTSNSGDILPSRRPLARHSSFELICDVAEKERNKLYFESKSQPASPRLESPVVQRYSESPAASTLSPMVNLSNSSLRRYVVIKSKGPMGPKQILQMAKGTVQGKTAAAASQLDGNDVTPSGVKVKRHPVLTLTKDEFGAFLSSIKSEKGGEQSLVKVAEVEQSPSENKKSSVAERYLFEAITNQVTPVQNSQRVLKRTYSEELLVSQPKKLLLSTAEDYVKAVSTKKPSPVRSLNLESTINQTSTLQHRSPSPKVVSVKSMMPQMLSSGANVKCFPAQKDKPLTSVQPVGTPVSLLSKTPYTTPVARVVSQEVRVIKEELSAARVTQAVSRMLHGKGSAEVNPRSKVMLVESSSDYITPVTTRKPIMVTPTNSAAVTADATKSTITPSANNIVNLGPLFASPPEHLVKKSSTTKFGPRRKQAVMGLHSAVRKPILVGQERPSTVSVETPSSITMVNLNPEQHTVKTPTVVRNQVFKTPQSQVRSVTPVPESTGSKIVVTPGTYFQNTPSMGHSRIHIGESSAFHAVGQSSLPFQGMGGAFATARKLSLPHNETQT